MQETLEETLQNVVERDLKANKLWFKKPDLLWSKNKRLNVILLSMALITFCCIGSVFWIHHRMSKLESKHSKLRHSFKMLSPETRISTHSAKYPMTPKLSGVPFAEDAKIVLGVKEIDIRNVTAPYNPSLVESRSGYDLFFRYDVFNPKLERAHFSSRIGVVPLNQEFKQTDQEFTRLDLESEYAEDPRALLVGEDLYLIYNKLDEKQKKCRFMSAANIDRNTYAVNYSTNLDMNLNWVEKNWSPFEYTGKDQKPRMIFEYRINPRKLLELPNPEINDLKNMTIPSDKAYLSLSWPEKWGQISGGTPAKIIGDEYLAFFHSWFKDEIGRPWYVMGAYTFSSKPPFHLTGISKHPILFKGIYETPFINTADINKRVIFPSGFVIEMKNDQELIHLACGENDCAVKVVTIDKKQLLKSMKRIETEENKNNK